MATGRRRKPEFGQVLGGPLVDPSVSASVSVHTEYTTTPPRNAAPPPQPEGTLQAGELVDQAWVDARRRVGPPARARRARCTVRRGAPGRTTVPAAEPATVGDDGGTSRRRRGCASGHDGRSRPGSTSSGDDATVVAHLLRDRRRLATRRGGEIGDAVAVPRVDDADDRLARLVLRRGARPSRTAASRPGSPLPRTITASGTGAPRATSTARDRNSASSASAVTRRGFGRSVTAAGSFIAASAPAAASAPRSASSRATSQSGYDQRDRTVGGLGPWRPESADGAEHAVREPTRAGRAGRDRGDRLPHRGVRRHVVEELVGPEAQGRTNRTVEPSDRSPRSSGDEVVEPALRPHRAVHGSVTNARSRSSSTDVRSISGTTMCAYAPSSIRTRASSASSRAESRACSCAPARWKLAQASHPRVRLHARLSLGLHLDRGEGTVDVVRSPHLHARSAHRGPRTRTRVCPRTHTDSSSTGRSHRSSNSSTVSFSA